MSLANDDSVVRCALWPSFLRKERVSEEHIVGPAMPYTSDKEVFGISVAARSFLPTVVAVHDYGCRTATDARKRQKEAPGNTLGPRELSHYLGFYEIAVEAIKATPTDHFDVDVVEWPELAKRMPEHCHVELRVRDLALSKGKRLSNATAFLGLIWEQMRGPEKHICAEDAADADLRSFLEEKQAQLPTMPRPSLVETEPAAS
jgi:hypothetical protein